MSPTQRTNAALKKLGATSQVVERWNMHARVRVDLFGVIDIVALIPTIRGCGTEVPVCYGIQCTSGSGSSRMAKAESEPRLKTWLTAGCRFEVWGWRKLKVGKRERWFPKIREAKLIDGVIVWQEREIT